MSENQYEEIRPDPVDVDALDPRSPMNQALSRELVLDAADVCSHVAGLVRAFAYQAAAYDPTLAERTIASGEHRAGMLDQVAADLTLIAATWPE